jgi:hypothetical protein
MMSEANIPGMDFPRQTRFRIRSAETSVAPSASRSRNGSIRFGPPSKSATFALNTGPWFRRGRFIMFTSPRPLSETPGQVIAPHSRSLPVLVFRPQ